MLSAVCQLCLIWTAGVERRQENQNASDFWEGRRLIVHTGVSDFFCLVEVVRWFIFFFFVFFSLAIPVISISLLNSLFHQWIMDVQVTPVSNLLLAFLGFYLKSDMRLIGHVYGTLHIIIKAWKIWAAEKLNGWLTCKWVERLCLCGSGWDKIISKASNIVASSCNFFFICCHQISTFMMKYSILFLCICLYYMSLLF